MNYDILSGKFRQYWSEGLPGAYSSKKYLNLLVGCILRRNSLWSTRDIVRTILFENSDLPGISEWKLMSNLDEKWQKYESTL